MWARFVTDLRHHWTTEECAKHLGVSVDWINASRCKGVGPPFYKLGRKVRYIPDAVEEWARSRQVMSTSEAVDE